MLMDTATGETTMIQTKPDVHKVWTRCDSVHDGRQCHHTYGHSGAHGAYNYDIHSWHDNEDCDLYAWHDNEVERPTRVVASDTDKSIAHQAYTQAIARRQRAWAEYTAALEAENIASQAYHARR